MYSVSRVSVLLMLKILAQAYRHGMYAREMISVFRLGYLATKKVFTEAPVV